MMNSRIAKSGINAVTAITQNLLNIGLTFISRMIFVQVLNAEYLGISSLFSNVLNVLALADLGMGTAMMYSLYKPLAQNDKTSICAYINFFKKIYFWIMTAVIVLGMALIPILPYIINLDKAIENYQIYYVLYLANVAISYLFAYRITLINADQKSYILNNYTIFFKILTFIGQTVVLIKFRDFWIYLIVEVGFNLLCYFTQNLAVVKRYPYIKNKAEKLAKEQKYEIKENVKSLFIYKLCGTLQGNTDTILISILCGTVNVGYYSNYLIVINAITTLMSVVFTSVKASVGNMVASVTAHEQEIKIFWILQFVNDWMVSFCSICLFCLLQECINIFFGDEYVVPFVVMTAIVINFYSVNSFQTIWVFRETTGLFNQTRYVALITAVLNAALSLVLGVKWGMFGILIATSISRYLYMAWKEPLLLFKNFFRTNPKSYFVNYIEKIIWLLITVGITYYLCSLIKMQNVYVGFGIKCMMCLLIPNAIFLCCFHKTEEFQYLWNMVMNFTKNKRKEK